MIGSSSGGSGGWAVWKSLAPWTRSAGFDNTRRKHSEAWSLRCEAPNGDSDTDSIVVDRGELKVADLDGCGRDRAHRLKAGEVPAPKPE